jgi:hypothetical protein
MNFLSRIRRRAAATRQGATPMATAIVLATVALGAGWARANGVGGGQAAGSNVSVTGNSVSAQAVGNTATDAIRLK